jgi:hypothetical protein
MFVPLLLGFAPLVVFCLLVRLSVSLALWIALATAFALLTRSFVETGVLRLFDAGNTMLLGLLAIYAGFIERGISISSVGMILELGLLGVAVWSLVVRRPFTEQYSRGQFSPAQRDNPLLVRMNYLLTWVWIATFAIMAAADAAAAFLPILTVNRTFGVGLAALVGALTFTWQSGVYIGRRLGKTPY